MASENVLVEKGHRTFVETNVSIKLPSSFYATLSGTEALDQLRAHVKNTVYDETFTGRIRVLLENNGPEDLPIMAGDKVATLVICPMSPPIIQVIIKFNFSHQ